MKKLSIAALFIFALVGVGMAQTKPAKKEKAKTEVKKAASDTAAMHKHHKVMKHTK